MIYKDKNAPIENRVKDLLSRMTLEEKVAQMSGIWQNKYTMLLDENKKFNAKLAKIHLQHGIGQIGRPSENSASGIGIPDGENALEMAEATNAIQKFFMENTRLGIPVIFHEECLHGHAANEATSYPQPIGLAGTFNPKLVEEIYSLIAEEMRARGGHQALTPVGDIARDPRWGRVEETFGEDTYLVSQMFTAAIRGFQGDRNYIEKKNVLATMKHFAAHGHPESGSNCGPVNISERELREVHFQPFKKAVEEEHVASVMASYNEINGIPSHANQWLLRDILRNDWGFEGFVVSDYDGIRELHDRPETFSHALAHDKKEAAILAAKAGVNVELPDNVIYPELIDAVNEGLIDVNIIDELVSQTLTYKFKLGLFDDPYIDPEKVEKIIHSEDRKQLAQKAAEQVITLLKNDDNLLPLDINEKKTIAVIGPNADRELLGGYSGKPFTYTSVLEGVRKKVGASAEVLYAEGCKITIDGSWNKDAIDLPTREEDEKLISEAVEIAKQADIVVMAIGGNEQTSREAWDNNHMGDRTDLDLFGRQNDLINAIKETEKPTVAFLFNGRPLAINNLLNKLDSVLECWYLGQATGNAVADVLFGDVNPGGKLPISFPRSVGHLPVFYNHKPSARRGYVHEKTSALLPFGFGLSYTTFEFTNFHLEKDEIMLGESAKISVEVKNTGKLRGDEVVQLYIRDVVSSVTRPVKELKDFQRVTLDAGEIQTVTFEITPDKLSFWNIDMEYVVEPGEFKLMIGNSSRDGDLQTLFLNVKSY